MSSEENCAKAELRTQISTARAIRSAALTTSARDEIATQLGNAVLAEPLVALALQQGPTVASYLALGSEPDTSVLNTHLLGRGIRVLVPECVTNEHGEPTLAWIELESGIPLEADEPIVDERGIPIPQGKRVGVGAQGLIDNGCSLVLVPALAATEDGNRLGKGAGYYDRLLSEANHLEAPFTTAAIVFADELLDTVPTEPHDISVDAVITV